ncbi:MAG: outer membrane beta-barrel protein [Pseudomonadota bacterium]
MQFVSANPTFVPSVTHLASAVVAIVLMASPVLARDSDQNREWAGCFVGVHAGGLWGKSEDWIVKTPGGDFFNQSLGGHHLSSAMGGVQAGCDLRRDGWVIGLGADYSWANADGSHPSRRETGVTYSSRIDATGSIAARAGYQIERVLLYVRGGFAWQEESYEASTTILGTAYTADETRFGWMVGLGGEYSLTDALSVFAEYDYRDFGSETIGLMPEIAGLRPASVEIESQTSSVRLGLNFRF